MDEDKMLLLIDNYDSFTWNLVHYLMELGAEVEITSDGGWHRWEGGQLLYETVFDIQPESVFS